MSTGWPDFNDLWDYDDPAATETKFRQILSQREQAGDRSYYLQLLTQLARTLSLQKRFDEAHAVLDDVEEALSDDGVENVVEIRYLLERGRTFNSDGQAEKAVPLFERASELATSAGAEFYAVDALHMLGIVTPPGERLKWHHKAIEYAENATQERARSWLGSLYNNLGWTHFEEGRHEQALALFQQALAQREGQGDKNRIRVARWCVGRALRAVGRVEKALAIQEALAGAGKTDGFIEEEIGECLSALGRHKEAAPYFRQAYERLSKIDWVADDKERIDRLRRLGG